jgi:hypothetical protein
MTPASFASPAGGSQGFTTGGWIRINLQNPVRYKVCTNDIITTYPYHGINK